MIDFHCHLDLYPDPEGEVREAEKARIYVLSVTTTPTAWVRTARLAKGHPRIRTALGLHPQLAHDRHHELGLLEELLPRTRYVGEIGLDGSPSFRGHADIQREVFGAVINASARMGGRILTVHSRRAVDDVLDVLARCPKAGVAILHWFSGTPAQLRRAVEMGCWFSVGPAMLRGDKGRQLAAAMPRSRLLTETDGPFATQGSRPLKPSDSWIAVDQLAKLWGMTKKEAGNQLLNNLRSLSENAPDPTRTSVHGSPRP